MPCYKPLKAYHGPNGITFNRKKSFGTHIELPCGRCIGCRLEKAKEWAIRCVHESQMHEDNIFLTLTYDDEHLPPSGELQHQDFQKFIRALRQKTKKKIRYYMCGEYGSPEKTYRPHYHAILFGYEFPDAEYATTRNENKVYKSELLTELWTHGFAEIGTVTFQSAGYVARYILKKAKANLNPFLESENFKPEYTRMSLRPGIGESWYRKYKTDVFPGDYVVTPDGRKMPAPKYYRRLLEREDPELYEKLKIARVEKARTNPDNLPARLETREYCQNRKVERLERNL